MRFAHRTLLIFPVLAVHAATLAPVAPPVTLSFAAARKSPARFQHGYFVAFDTATSGVWCFDRKGAAVTAIQLDSIGASGLSRVQLRDAAVAPDASLAVAGGAYSNEGALVSFIAWIRPGGAVARVVRTSPFAAANLAFAGDMSLWAFGRERDANYRDALSHDVIRRYGADGKLLASMVKNDSFAGDARYHPAYQAAMASAGGRVGIFSFTASEWIEVDANGGLAGRWRISGLSAFEGPVAAAMTPDGVFLSVFKGDGPASVYRLNKSTGSLEQVSSAPDSHVGGADGSQLVLITGAEAVWVELK